MLINEGLQIQVHAYSGLWSPIKRPIHTIHTGNILLSQIPQPIIHANAQVHPEAQISGNTYIGANVIIDENSEVHDSHILDDTVIQNSRLINSYISKFNKVQDSHLKEVVSTDYAEAIKQRLQKKLIDSTAQDTKFEDLKI